MDTPAPIDRVGSLLTGYSEALAADLRASGAAPRLAAISRSLGGWDVFVIVCPKRPGQDTPGLSACERDCLAFLAAAQQPKPAYAVRDGLENEHNRIHGLITVKRALARLHRLGLVSVSRRCPRGCFLPEALPLVKRSA
jgi:hypothetical protein